MTNISLGFFVVALGLTLTASESKGFGDFILNIPKEISNTWTKVLDVIKTPVKIEHFGSGRSYSETTLLMKRIEEITSMITTVSPTEPMTPAEEQTRTTSAKFKVMIPSLVTKNRYWSLIERYHDTKRKKLLMDDMIDDYTTEENPINQSTPKKPLIPYITEPRLNKSDHQTDTIRPIFAPTYEPPQTQDSNKHEWELNDDHKKANDKKEQELVNNVRQRRMIPRNHFCLKRAERSRAQSGNGILMDIEAPTAETTIGPVKLKIPYIKEPSRKFVRRDRNKIQGFFYNGIPTYNENVAPKPYPDFLLGHHSKLTYSQFINLHKPIPNALISTPLKEKGKPLRGFIRENTTKLNVIMFNRTNARLGMDNIFFDLLLEDGRSIVVKVPDKVLVKKETEKTRRNNSMPRIKVKQQHLNLERKTKPNIRKMNEVRFPVKQNDIEQIRSPDKERKKAEEVIPLQISTPKKILSPRKISRPRNIPKKLSASITISPPVKIATRRISFKIINNVQKTDETEVIKKFLVLALHTIRSSKKKGNENNKPKLIFLKRNHNFESSKGGLNDKEE